MICAYGGVSVTLLKVLFDDGVVLRDSHVVVVHLHAFDRRRGDVGIPQWNHRQVFQKHAFALSVQAHRLAQIGFGRGLVDQCVELVAFVIAVVQALAVGR